MKKLKLGSYYCIGSAMGFLIASSPAFAFQHSIVIKEVKHDISLPLRDIPVTSYKQNLTDKIRSAIKTNASLVNITAFQGIGSGLGGYTPTTAAPQVAGAVGNTQYVQWVDPDIGVFDKNTGAIAAGFPKPGSAIWTGFGGPCETANIGTPAVKYDHVNNRWVLAREAYTNITSGPFYECVAVSTTSDATGSYYRYAFPMDSLSKFGSIGLWTDAYYISLFMNGPVSNGPRACALDKNKMLIGAAATTQCVQLSFAQSGILRPATLEGGQTIPTGYPGYFFSLDPPNNIQMFKFFTDWVNPSKTTMTNAVSIPVNDFTVPCATTSGTSCAVQPDTTNKLDVLGTSFPSRINFRQFPDHSSFVLTHNIQGPPPKLSPAIRWYELRMANDPTANPVVYQQQTLAPDSKARYVGSIAIDRLQNIAVGYTVSSSAVHPSPELGYHNYFDLLNNMTIQPLVTGLASQTNISNWTNYSTMTIDPTDSCTFWYSSEYLLTQGSLNWSTAIMKFKLAGC